MIYIRLLQDITTYVTKLHQKKTQEIKQEQVSRDWLMTLLMTKSESVWAKV